MADLPDGTTLVRSQDVASEGDWRQVVADVFERLGRIVVILNNAGASDRQLVPLSTAETTDEADWDRVMATNLEGPNLASRISCHR